MQKEKNTMHDIVKNFIIPTLTINHWKGLQNEKALHLSRAFFSVYGLQLFVIVNIHLCI